MMRILTRVSDSSHAARGLGDRRRPLVRHASSALIFLWCAVRQLGWRRTLLYAVVAVGVGGLAENGSVHLGVPYTRYAFNDALRGEELFLGDVPLMVPLSYTFMAYFAFAAGRLLASRPVSHARACGRGTSGCWR